MRVCFFCLPRRVDSATATVTLNAKEFDVTPALGLMVVAPDNKAGAGQAVIIPVH